MKRLNNIGDNNKDQLQEIEDQGERQLDMINKDGKKQLEAIEKQEEQLKKSKIKKSACRKSWDGRRIKQDCVVVKRQCKGHFNGAWNESW